MPKESWLAQPPAPPQKPVHAKEAADQPEYPNPIPRAGEFARRDGIGFFILQFSEELSDFRRLEETAAAGFGQLAQKPGVGRHLGLFQVVVKDDKAGDLAAAVREFRRGGV